MRLCVPLANRSTTAKQAINEEKKIKINKIIKSKPANNKKNRSGSAFLD